MTNITSQTYSVRISRHWSYRNDGPPVLVTEHVVWRGETRVSGHPSRAEADAKISLLRKYQTSLH